MNEQNIVSRFEQMAQQQPEQLAILSPQVALTFAQVAAKSNQIANFLLANPLLANPLLVNPLLVKAQLNTRFAADTGSNSSRMSNSSTVSYCGLSRQLLLHCILLAPTSAWCNLYSN